MKIIAGHIAGPPRCLRLACLCLARTLGLRDGGSIASATGFPKACGNRSVLKYPQQSELLDGRSEIGSLV